MKTVKYLILSLFTVVVLATATELFRAYCLADEPYDHFYIRDISDESDSERIQGICELLRENGLRFVLVNRSGTDEETVEISYLCSSSEVQKQMEERFHEKGVYRGLFYGSVRIRYAKDISSFLENVSNTVTVYVLNAPDDYRTLPVSGDYLEGEITRGEEGNSVYLIAISAMVLLILLSLLLLSLFEAYLSKKRTAIRILNGEPVTKIVGQTILGEIIGIVAAFGIPFLLLYPYCHNLPFLTKLWAPIGITVCIDLIILLSTVIRIRIREIFGNAGGTTGVMTICHTMQVICAIVFLIMGTLSVGMIGQYIKLKEYDDALRNYEDYRFLTGVYDVPKENLLQAIGNSLICDNVSSFMSGSGKEYEIFYANRNAWEMIAGVVGQDEEPYGSTICFVPEEIKDEYANQPENWGEAKHFVSYRSEDRLRLAAYCIVYEDSISLKEDFYVTGFTAPIIVFFPDDEVMSRWRSSIRLIRKDATGFIEGGEQTDLYQLYRGCVSQRKFGAILFGGIAVMLGIMLVALSALSLRLNYSVNAVELCVEKVSGGSIFARYQGMLSLQALAMAIGTGVAAVLAHHLEMSVIGPIVFGFGSLAVILLLLLIMIQSWERENTVKVLKGGAI